MQICCNYDKFCNMDNKAYIPKILRENGYSITSQRLSVFDALQQIDDPITITQLADKLTDMDRVSVYRTVELFEKVGIVHRLWTGFKSKIELSENFSPHHHHFTCLECDETIGLNSEVLEKDLKDFECEYGFELTQHSVELSGYCTKCKYKHKK